ncbi:MAG: ROK family protein [Phycisphaerales bacterium]|nr:ROK family protein [Phycisphaerales bacterium]
MSDLLAGIDIGGTKIGVCLGNTSGQVLDARRFELERDADAGSVLDRAVALLEEMTAAAGAGRPVALGVPCPGPIDYATRSFVDPPNMPAWHGVAVVEELERRFEGPVAMMNDANATVLAEWQWGAAAGAGTVISLTMSTGKGAGFILGGHLFEGPLGLAGEIGHLRLHDDGPVGFGKRGSVEGYLSGPGMLQVAEAEARICRQTGEASDLLEGELTVERLCELARRDSAARRVTDRCADELGRLLALLVDVLNPEIVVLGTIGTAHFDLFEPGARAVIDRECIERAAKLVRITPSGLADRSSQSALAVAARAVGASDVH